jgi:hypothetical protein
MTALSALLIRDMRLAVRVGGGALMGVLFFLIVVTITPFAIGPDLAQLQRIGPAILWIGALLASRSSPKPPRTGSRPACRSSSQRRCSACSSISTPPPSARFR